MEKKSGSGYFAGSFFILILALGSLAAAIYYIMKPKSEGEFLFFIPLCLALMWLSHRLAKQGLEISSSVFGRILFVLTFIQYYLAIGVFFVFGLIYLFLKKLWDMEPVQTTRVVETKDKNGDKHTLTQEIQGGKRYKDENGDYWKTEDDGKTFTPD